MQVKLINEIRTIRTLFLSVIMFLKRRYVDDDFFQVQTWNQFNQFKIRRFSNFEIRVEIDESWVNNS